MRKVSFDTDKDKDTDTERQPPRRRLPTRNLSYDTDTDTQRQLTIRRLMRKLSFRRTLSESKLNPSEWTPKRSLSTRSVIAAETDVCSENNSPFGCLKVRTQDDSVSRVYCSDDLERKSVAFTTIEVRTYPIILGDNPSVSSGPPFTIDWDHQDVVQINLSDYEQLKPVKRTRKEIALTARARESWLRAEGYARSEIEEVGKEVHRIKKCRNAVIPKEHHGPAFRFW